MALSIESNIEASLPPPFQMLSPARTARVVLWAQRLSGRIRELGAQQAG